MSNYYWAVQYSAIQKLILRHDRLWSMAGISRNLAYLNEVELVDITEKHDGKVLVAGGGKFTARFANEDKAKEALRETIDTISRRFPMLEFQASSAPIPADDLETARAAGLINELNERKRAFRGYGLTFNPHLHLCDECSEYPATQAIHYKDHTDRLCSLCGTAKKDARHSLTALPTTEDKDLTTIEKIYKQYLGAAGSSAIEVPLDFNNLFPEDKQGERNRIAVWFSDINSMNDKVPLWLTRPPEEEKLINGTFAQVKQVNIDIIARALRRTFPNPRDGYLPFRIIVAGGDDLCIVMAEEYIMQFAVKLDEALHLAIVEVGRAKEHPLNPDALERARLAFNSAPQAVKTIDENKPYSFGAAFVVCSPHTPFSRIHATGEHLMGVAKKESDRYGNAVHWTVMAEEESEATRLLDFEKPVFINKNTVKSTGARSSQAWPRLDLVSLLELRKLYANISSSHSFQIINEMIRNKNNPTVLHRNLQFLDSAERDKDFSGLLTDPALLDENQRISGKRLASLFELACIKRRDS